MRKVDVKYIIRHIDDNIAEMKHVYSDYYDEESENIHYARGMSSDHVTKMIEYFNTFKCAIEDMQSVGFKEFEVASRRIVDHANFVINNVNENGFEDRGYYSCCYDDSSMIRQDHDEMIEEMEDRKEYIQSMRNSMDM